MIVILDGNFKKLGVVKNCISSTRREELNGENTLDFEAILDSKLSDLLDKNSIFEVDDDYFDTAVFKKIANDDGTYTVEDEAEHVSYRLNNPDYDVEYFTEDGTPEYILGKILAGTGFTIGTIEFDSVITYSAQEVKSRRQLLMEFVAYLKGEVKFHKFEVSIFQHRGRVGIHPLIKDKDVKVLSKSVNKREKDADGNPVVSYEITPMNSDGTPYELGDNVRLIQRKLEINEDLRVVTVTYDPYNKQDVTYTFSNYENGLESAIFRINRDTLIKDKVYNGIRISPEIGFEAVLSNKLARSYFAADRMVFQTGDGTGENWYDKLYYALDTITGTAEMYFGGKLTADVLSAISAEIDFVLSEATITEALSAQKGYIAELTVDSLETSNKVANYLIQDMSDVNYIKIFDQNIQFVTASTDGSETEQAKNRIGQLLYWTDDTYSIAITDETDHPVMIYKYTEYIKSQIAFVHDGTNYIPQIIMGTGSGNTEDRGKPIIYKATDGFYIDYRHSVTGAPTIFKITDDGIDLSMFPNVIYSEDVVVNQMTQLWVQATNPRLAKKLDVWVDTDDYSRFDYANIFEDTSIYPQDPEVYCVHAGVTINLYFGGVGGIVRTIKNLSEDIVTVITNGTKFLNTPPMIDGDKFLIYPSETINLISIADGRVSASLDWEEEFAWFEPSSIMTGDLTIAERSDGKIHCVWSNGTEFYEGICEDLFTLITQSDTVEPYPIIIETEQGNVPLHNITTLGFCSVSNVNGKLYLCVEHIRNIPTSSSSVKLYTKSPDSEIWVYYSTILSSVIVPEEGLRDSIYVNMAGRILKAKNGNWVIIAGKCGSFFDIPVKKLQVYVSNDNGLTWTFKKEIRAGGAHQDYYFGTNINYIANTFDGNLYLSIASSYGFGTISLYESIDNGSVWDLKYSNEVDLWNPDFNYAINMVLEDNNHGGLYLFCFNMKNSKLYTFDIPNLDDFSNYVLIKEIPIDFTEDSKAITSQYINNNLIITCTNKVLCIYNDGIYERIRASKYRISENHIRGV